MGHGASGRIERVTPCIDSNSHHPCVLRSPDRPPRNDGPVHPDLQIYGIAEHALNHDVYPQSTLHSWCEAVTVLVSRPHG